MTTENEEEATEETGNAPDPNEAFKRARLAEKRAKELETKLTQYERKDAFTRAMQEANVDGITFEELGELPPDQITPTLLKAKAQEKQEQSQAALETLAKSAGFEDTGAFSNALKALIEEQNKVKEGQARVAVAATVNSQPQGSEPVDAVTWGRMRMEGKITHAEWEQGWASGRVRSNT